MYYQHLDLPAQLSRTVWYDVLNEYPNHLQLLRYVNLVSVGNNKHMRVYKYMFGNESNTHHSILLLELPFHRQCTRQTMWSPLGPERR